MGLQLSVIITPLVSSLQFLTLNSSPPHPNQPHPQSNNPSLPYLYIMPLPPFFHTQSFISQHNYQNMCIGSNTFLQAPKLGIFSRKPIKLTRVRLLRLTRRSYKQQKGRGGKDMVVKNLKLYMKNMSIREENEKLREKACVLHQENLALMSEFRKRFSDKCDVGSMAANITTLPK